VSEASQHEYSQALLDPGDAPEVEPSTDGHAPHGDVPGISVGANGNGAGAAALNVPFGMHGHQAGSAVSKSFGGRDYLIRRLLALSDLASILFGLLVMVAISDRARATEHLAWGLLIVPVWLALLAGYGLYNRDIKRISHSVVDDLPWILHAVLVACLLTWLYFNVVPVPKLHFFDILLFGGIAAPSMLFLRASARRATMQVLGAERVLVVGDGGATDLLVRKMRVHPEYRLDPVGIVRPTDGRLDLDEELRRYRPERLILCETHLDETTLLGLVHHCRELSVKVSVLPKLFGAMGPSVEVDDVEGVTVLGINPPVLPRSSRLMKRSLDIVTSATALLIIAPLMAMVALAIKLGSRGPVFFRQRRIGKEGRPFHVVKFRTMVADAERQKESLMSESQEAGWLKLERDPRITRVGRFLRLASVDELPQLWNILKGEMSLVGPRPLIESEDCQIGGWARSRLELTPGLTGLWQVLGRTNIPFDEMVKLDYLYVTNWSLWTDLSLILRTLPAVFSQRGAN
jgi:exopolysaccharide biosynthesis polyprenyl glycosylphosphotransferase